MSRVPAGATAYPQRNAHYIMNVHTRWRDPAEDAACIGWARGLFQGAAKYALGSAYVNFMPDDESDRIEKVYGPNYRRLSRNQAALRPGQSVPVEPEHQAEQRPSAPAPCRSCTFPSTASSARLAAAERRGERLLSLTA